MKRSILWIFTSLILVLALAACAPQQPTNNPNAPVRQLTASGIGEVYLVPDVAYVNIGVQSQSPDVAEALSQNNVQSQAVADELAKLGVEAKDIQTSAFNISPQQQYSPEGKMTGVIYIVNNTVFVTVRDLQKLGQMLDAVVKSGANSINSVSFDVLDKTSAITQARKVAIENARKNAEEIAADSGVQLGNLITVNTYVPSGPVPVYEGKGGAQAASVGQVPVAAGQLLLTVNADMTFEIR